MEAVSSWNLRLPKEFRPFAYETIADVKLRISYSAREDEELRATIDKASGDVFKRLRETAPRVAVSFRRDFPTEWARFKDALANTAGRYGASIRRMSYPWWLRDRLIAEEDVVLHVIFEKKANSPVINAQSRRGHRGT